TWAANWSSVNRADVDDRLGEGLRGFLGQVVPDAACDGPVLVVAGELAGVGAGVRVRRAVGVAFERDGGHGDGPGGTPRRLQVVVVRLAGGQAQPPPIIVDHDGDVIGVVEGGRGARERGVIEGPPRGGELPDEPVELAPVPGVAGPAALGGEVVLVPPGV